MRILSKKTQHSSNFSTVIEIVKQKKIITKVSITSFTLLLFIYLTLLRVQLSIFLSIHVKNVFF